MGDHEKGAKPGLKTRLLHELKHVGLITLYFLTCFTIIGLLRMLFLAQYGVDGVGLGKVVVGALVVGKVVAVLDMTSLGDRFKHHRVVWFVLYRSLVYTTAVAVFLAIERVIHELGHTDSLAGAVSAAVAGADASRFYANVLCLFLTFLGYNTMSAVGHHLGERELVGFLFSRRDTAGQ